MKEWSIKYRQTLRVVGIFPALGTLAIPGLLLSMFCDSGSFCKMYYNLFPLSYILSLAITMGPCLVVDILLLRSKRETMPTDSLCFCALGICFFAGIVLFPLLLLLVPLAIAGFIAKFILFLDYLHPAQNTPQPVSYQITPLLNAVLNGDLKLVQATLAEHPEMLNMAYAKNGNTPLHVAALTGHTEIVQFLLTQPDIDKDRKNNDGKTAFDLAAERGGTNFNH